MTALYRLLADAEADLRAIIRYTRKEWGEAQARDYAAKLKLCIEGMVAGDAGAKDMGALYPGLQMMRCEYHFIFCLFSDDAPALVVALLHERMDLMARLADRLR